MTKRRWLVVFLFFIGVYVALVGVAQVTQSDPPVSELALRWGGDRSGGGPFIYEDKDGELTGFEVDLADYLAKELGKESDFHYGQWDKLPFLLDRQDIDIVLNGYEWTPEREAIWASTIPYYKYRLQLLVRKDNDSITSWDDLRARPGQPRKKVGVLTGSAAQRYLEQRFGDDVEIRAYGEGVASAMMQVENGVFDATVQDSVVFAHYQPNYPQLHPIKEEVAPGYYVIFLRKRDHELRERLNEAIRKAMANGVLYDIYTRYGIWNADQKDLLEEVKEWKPSVAEPVSWLEMRGFALKLLRAAWTTVLLSCISMPLAMLIGLLVAIGRLYGPAWLNWPLAFYVEVIRGTPLLFQLYVIYFLLPMGGIIFPAFWAGVIGLAINYSAYEAENYRAGFLAIPRGQLEAALALGMSKRAAVWRILAPQAVRIVIPPVTNDFIALFKDTSVCSVVSVTELTGRYSELINNQPGLVIELGLLTAALYLMMSYPLSLLARLFEQRFSKTAA